MTGINLIAEWLVENGWKHHLPPVEPGRYRFITVKNLGWGFPKVKVTIKAGKNSPTSVLVTWEIGHKARRVKTYDLDLNLNIVDHKSKVLNLTDPGFFIELDGLLKRVLGERG